MRLVGQIHITVRGDIVRRDPTLWDKLKRGLGAQVDLETGEMQNQLEATAVVDAVRRALGRLDVDNALSLIVDDTVIFEDADGKPGDLPDLVLALADHSSVFGRGFKELRFAAEHEEAGLHLVIETRARTRHRRDEPAAVISVGGRIRAFEPGRGESADAYRARVEPLTKDAALFEASRHAFESFVARLQQALAAAMPEAEVTEQRADARLVKPSTRQAAAPERVAREPMHPAYDPFLVYYPSPMGLMLDAMIFSSMMNMMMPPPLMVVSPMGAPLGSMTDVDAIGDPDVVDAHQGDTDLASYDGASDTGVDPDTSLDASDSVWGDGGGWDDGGGGDFGGGDFGGGGDF
jgi:uncharacterized membrane protein YgcG